MDPSRRFPRKSSGSSALGITIGVLVFIIIVMIMGFAYHYKNMTPDYYNLSPDAERKLWESGSVNDRKKIILAKLYNFYNDTMATIPESKAVDDYLKVLTYDQFIVLFQLFRETATTAVNNPTLNSNLSSSNADKLMQLLTL